MPYFINEVNPYLEKLPPCDGDSLELNVWLYNNGNIDEVSYRIMNDTCACNSPCMIKKYPNSLDNDEYELFEGKSGAKNGKYLLYQKGILRQDGQYKNGMQVGEWRIYDKKGILIKRQYHIPPTELTQTQ